MNEMKTSIAPNSSEGRAQRRNPSLSNSKEESREISMVVIREPGRSGAKAEKIIIVVDDVIFKMYVVKQ